VLLITQRAKQIQKGGRPQIERGKLRATRIAFEEVERGLIGFEFMGEFHEADGVNHYSR
jgi:DNA-directed RNA polymerase subunit K/omega